jgi:hypothetical protein
LSWDRTVQIRAALAAPAPDAGCVAKVVAQDRALYFPLGGQVSAIAQDPGNLFFPAPKVSAT